MKLKTNAAPELELTTENGLLVKKGSGPVFIKDETFKFFTVAYENVAAKNGDKAVMTLGEGKSASTFFFAYDEDSKQNVLFVDGYLVTKISTKGNKINVYTTNSNVAYKSFEEKDLITNKMAALDNAIKAENDVKAAKEEVVKYFNVKRIEKPILMQAEFEVSSREEKIAAIRKEIEAIKTQRAEKEAELQPLLKDKKTTQNSKKVKELNKEIDELKAKENAKEEDIIAINAELDGPIAVLNKKIENCKKDLAEENKKSDDKKDQKKVKALEKEIAKYEGEIVKFNQTKVISDLEEKIKTLEETRKANNSKIVDAKANLEVVQARANDRVEGKSVAVNSKLKTAKEYRAEIEKLNNDNDEIDEQISQLNVKIENAKNTSVNNLGYRDQLTAFKEEYDIRLAKVDPKSALAKAKIDEIEKAVKYPDGDMKIEIIAKVENEKYQIATESFAKEIEVAAADINAQKEALRNDNAGNLYVRAQEVIDQPKYAQLYNFINGYTPVFWGTDVTLKGKPSYGCLVVGPKLNEGQNITGISKNTLNRAMYLVVGKTIDEVRKSLPETAEDFLNIEGATVYAADHISSKKDYTKAFAKVYKNTNLLKDKKGDAVLDVNGRKQFAPSTKMANITLDIKTEQEIAKLNEAQAEKAKKTGKKVDERIVDYVTPEMLENISIKLGSKECLDTEKTDYWKYNYTKSKAKTPLIVGAVMLGAAALAAGVTYHFVNENEQNARFGVAAEELEAEKTPRNIAAAEKYGADRWLEIAEPTLITYTNTGDAVVNYSGFNDNLKKLGHFEQDKLPENANDVYVVGGALKEAFKGIAEKLAEQGNITSFDGDYKTLFMDYAEGYDFYTFTKEDEWYPTADGYKNGTVVANYYWDMGFEGYVEGAQLAETKDPSTAGQSIVDPQNEKLNDAAQKKINKEIKGTNKAMVVDGVYIDFVNDTAFAVSEDGKNIVKLTYADDIRLLDDAISGMNDATTDWYTCAAANPFLPGEKYRDFYISDKTNINGEVYSKNIIEVEKEEGNYKFTERKGHDVLNTVENKMPSNNEIAYLAIAGEKANITNDGYLMVYSDKGTPKTYTATTPEDAEASNAGQIFGYVNPKNNERTK